MDEEILVAEGETELTQPPEFAFATVGEVYEDGISLIFDGETEPSEKHYKVNTSVVFHAGDRVKIASDAGTYVAEYVVGNPGTTAPHELPAGGSENQALRKTSATDYDVAWSDVHEIPSGGSAGQALVKKSGTNYDAQWVELVPAKIENKINSAASYAIEFRTTTIYGTPVFQIRMGPYGTWFTITLS